ncbi:UDP-N-acetylmuramoyl-tripeptide--D-alanyl-D-alanine ligase [Paenibacillus spiritus]|uniref:UDP-N-acetylmuramoyl-tripeptide--D-alanyl-D-alanine ligase n=1 Tax=Paenibacillus spiritus TaxID=2496557 RepID=A0A5J5GHP7_9BACL|nr:MULTISPECIES: UDP-N-acetylmuramoyl-tripeptide--D-alanyl-D-alanine ligase [Paenibacillus]KAA9007756.1 UDP-N-acetylmuramoyl-tripeptide--D-alanyl-D-alanine ligase [Paenibacillus spiritus]
MTKTIEQIAAMCGGVPSPGAQLDAAVSGVVTDSRKLSPGCLFVPLAGERFDGHDYGAAALAEGAGGLLWQRDKGPAPEGNAVLVEDTLAALQRLASAYLKETAPRVVGITGSNGKTTTKDMVTALLATRYRVHKTQGNFNNHIGLPLTILSMPEDTEIAVLEMGMSARGEIALLTQIAPPDVAVITNIGESHLLQLGSRLEIARAKLEIAEGLKPGGLLILNGDEPLLAQVMSEPGFAGPKEMQTVRFGMDEANDDYPTGLLQTDGATSMFTCRTLGDRTLTLPLPGMHNVINALAAIAVARHFGLDGAAITEGFGALKLTGMRIEVTKTAAGVTLLNDAYNASPTSMRAALEVLQGMKAGGSRIAVLGDMLELGEREIEFHREIGAGADPERIDAILTCGPLSRHLAEAARERGIREVHAFEDKEELGDLLVRLVRPGDVVLFKASRGMRLEEVLRRLQDGPETAHN